MRDACCPSLALCGSPGARAPSPPPSQPAARLTAEAFSSAPMPASAQAPGLARQTLEAMAAQRRPLPGAPSPAPGPSASFQAPVSHALADCASSHTSSRVPSVEAPDALSCGPAVMRGYSAGTPAALYTPGSGPDEASLCSAALTAGRPQGGCGVAAGEPVSNRGAQGAAASAAPGQPVPWGAPEGGCGAAAGEPVSVEHEAEASAAPGELQVPQSPGNAGGLGGAMWLPANVRGANGLVETEVQVCCVCFNEVHS